MLQIVDSMKKAVKYWWTSLLIGILAIIVGICCFASPDASLVGLTYVFITVFLLGGILEIIFAISNRNYMYGWGWTLAGGILEVLLGVLLLTLPTSVVTVMLIYLVGFWILFRAIWGIGEACKLQTSGVKGWGWLLAIKIICLHLAFLYLLSPVSGGLFVIVFIGL